MSRINPLHIIGLLLVILLFIFFKLNGIKEELVQVKQTLSQTQQLSKEVVALKKVYGDKKRIKRELQKILRYSTLRSANIQKEYKKSGVLLTCESIELAPLNTLMSKLLNNSFHIERLKIKKLSDKTAQLHLEIKW